MTPKQFLKEVNNMPIEQARKEILNTDKWRFISFIRLLSDFKDREVVYEIACTKHPKIISKIIQVEWAYDFLQWCKETNHLRTFLYQERCMKKYLQFDKVIRILCPECPGISKIFVTDSALHFITLLLNNEDWYKSLVKTIKDFSSYELWSLKYHSEYPRYKPYIINYILINNNAFIKTFNINDYKRNPKCLFLFLIKDNIFNEQQINNILINLKNTLTYQNTNINDFPFKLLKKEYYDYIKPSLMIKELQKGV